MVIATTKKKMQNYSKYLMKYNNMEKPILVIYPGNTMYTNVQESDINEIWESHIKNGVVVERLTSENEQNFFNKQMRISLRNCGRINPENIDEYIAYDGYILRENNFW